MTDQQYSDCQFEIYFDTVEGRHRGGAPRCLKTLPIQLNGIQHSDDARRTKDYGVEAI